MKTVAAGILAILAGAASSAHAEGWDQNARLDRLLRDDAGLRTSYSAAAGGGWEKGSFYITDGGANKLTPYGFVHFRYLMNFRDEDGVGNQDDLTQGFEMRRSRIGLKGTIWDKDLSFDIIGEFSRSSGTFALLDAFGQYKWENGVALKWGQFKFPLLREEIVSDPKQTAVERSTMNAAFTQGRSQGIELAYAEESFRGWVAFSDGLNTVNTDFTSGSEADYAFTARGEFRWGADDFKRFDDMASWRGSQFAGMVAAAVHYQDGGETGGSADTAIAQATIDCSLEGDGWTAFLAGVWRNTDAAGGPSTDDFGAVAQVGYLVTDQLEPYLRWDAIFADDANGDDFHTITAGFNYYFSPASNAVKFSLDVLYHLDAEADSAIVSPNPGADLLADTEDGQIAIRLQMLVMF
jgi:hypothetical protein